MTRNKTNIIKNSLQLHRRSYVYFNIFLSNNSKSKSWSETELKTDKKCLYQIRGNLKLLYFPPKFMLHK